MKTLVQISAAAIASLGVHAAASEIIVFNQTDQSPLGQEFEQSHLPEIRKLAESLSMEIKTVNVTEQGAPEEVDITPLIVYQDHRGRSIYQGRYAKMERLKNFLRTARMVTQGENELTLEGLPVMPAGDVSIGAPIKITPLEGETIPANFEESEFRRAALNAISEGLSDFQWQDTATFGRTDRQFYWDFYPFAVEDNQLVIALAIYSQFNCHDPVFTAYNDEIIGPFSDTERLFADAAALMERTTKELIATSDQGDGFDLVSDTVKTVTWEQLGLSLPPIPETNTASLPEDFEMPRQWRIVSGQENYGLFRFPSPLDSYAGQILQMNGTLTFPENLDPDKATGSVTVPSKGVTMGNPALDDTVYDSIAAEDYPETSFHVKSVQSRGALEFGSSTQLYAEGEFRMKGISVPLNVTSELTPGLNDEGEPRLTVTASYSVNIADPFQIEGPPGPEDAASTMEFFLQFEMEPAS